MMETPGLAARLLLQRPERVADAWRGARCAEARQRSVLDGVLISFLREIGAQLAGASGSAWERTTGVLKLCIEEGTGFIHDELATLRRVLDGALETLEAPFSERLIADSAIDEALASTSLAYEQLRHPEHPAPSHPRFGGVVVERFEPFARRKDRPGDGPGLDWHEWHRGLGEV